MKQVAIVLEGIEIPTLRAMAKDYMRRLKAVLLFTPTDDKRRTMLSAKEKAVERIMKQVEGELT